jgi:hypothetical protein
MKLTSIASKAQAAKRASITSEAQAAKRGVQN